MRYTKDKFTEEELNAMEYIATITAMCAGISLEELRSKRRTRVLADARCLAIYLQYHTVDVQSVKGSRTYQLSTWYFDIDHTTSSYSVAKCNDLMATDSNFKLFADNVKGLINDSLKEIDMTYVEMLRSRRCWEDVRFNLALPPSKILPYMPLNILDRIISMKSKGYDDVSVAYEVKTTDKVVRAVASKYNIKLPVKTTDCISSPYKQPKAISSSPRLIISR
jgi:hypothetical protein